MAGHLRASLRQTRAASPPIAANPLTRAPAYADAPTIKHDSSAELDRIRASIPPGRFGEPADVAELVLFLGSEDNRHVTGQVLTIDGGFSVQ